MRKQLSFALLFLSLAAHAQEITFFTPNTVRVVKQAPDTSKETDLSLVVTAKPQRVSVTRKEQGNTVTYKSSALTVTVNTDTKQVTFADARGNVLLSEGSMQFTPITEGPDQGRYKVKQAWTLDNNEPIYGLGLLQNGKMNQRGENRLMQQSNLEDYAHFFQSIKGYGIYWDNYSPTQIHDRKELSFEAQVGCKVDYYFM
ncbi:MAG: DUF4968 domain-containing protein, partial [Bacteroidaceae bacterium]|nr:DUF4968 domain-containing protein [Bacteroidaceae bacterium]